jgi:hypothetical protein
MIDDFELLNLRSPVGKGQENDPSDVEALDDRLRKVGAYSPPPEYADNPQRYATEPMIGSLERYQERNGLKVDGVVKPGGPTERTINNHLLEKPRGAGLLHDPPAALTGRVGNGFENRPSDVVSVKRQLGALGYGPEDPFDRPSGFIEEATTGRLKDFQRAKGLTVDGWLAPGGETERALQDALINLARAKGGEWLEFMKSANRADAIAPAEDDRSGAKHGATPAYYDPRGDRFGGMIPKLEGGWSRRGGGPGRGSDSELRRPPAKMPSEPRAPNADMPGHRTWPGPLVPPPIRPSKDDAEREPQLPSRPIGPQIYIPEPGSPLRIPIVDIHHGGKSGDQRSIETTKATTDAVEKACKDVFGEKEVSFERKMEKHYPGPHKGSTKGSSFADEWAGMTVKGKNFMIDFVSDSYTSRVDGSPTANEERRFVNLEYNRRGEMLEVTVRVPKVWKFGQKLDNEKLYEAARKICEQIKNLIDKDEIGPDKRLKILEKLGELVKPKKGAAPEPKEPSGP